MSRPDDADPLRVNDLHDDPIHQFGVWLTEAEHADVPEPTAMTLATVSGIQPSARWVLLKGHSPAGFVFFTNYNSRKSREIAETGRAALCFGWLPIHRQVRIEGPIERIDEAASDEYFATRPRGAQIAAAISNQSEPTPSRAELEEAFHAFATAHENHPIPRPSDWGGFRVIPELMEFWQGRRDRLHDRFRYQRVGSGWRKQRLQP